MMYRLDLVEMAKELIAIQADFPLRIINPKTTIGDFEFRTFIQVWESTALGFGGVGGSAIASARTYVLIPCSHNDASENCIVYFSGRFAYSVPYSKVFMNDVVGENMKGCEGISRYLRGVE